MPSHRALVNFSLAVQLCLSIGVLVTAILSMGGNYLVDRTTGNPVVGADKTLFSVSKGESFVVRGAAATRVRGPRTAALTPRPHHRT